MRTKKEHKSRGRGLLAEPAVGLLARGQHRPGQGVPMHVSISNNPPSTSKKNCGDEERLLCGAVEKPTDKTCWDGEHQEI
jgi:hypothetical protein